MNFINEIINWFNTSGTKLAFTILLIVLSLFLMMIISGIIKKVMLKTSVDNAIISFVVSVFKIIYLLVVIFVCAGVLNLDTASLVVGLSTIALAVGLALKDSFSNLANGVLILINKPFKSGDHVKIGGVEGKVWMVKLFTVELVTFDNTKIVIPNSAVLTSEVINYTAFPVRRVDMIFTVAYGSDLDKVERVLTDVAKANPMVLQNLGITVIMSNQGDSAIEYSVRVWVDTPNYATVKNSLNKAVYLAFTQENIDIPYNQLDVNIKQ